jgi:Ca2+-binding RTX toxin-like protein
MDKLIGSDAIGEKLHGNNGDDILVGSIGNDLLDGGNGFDTVDYSGSAAGISLNLATGAKTGTQVVGDTYTNIERFIGTNLNDTFVGDAGNTTFNGLAGNDSVDGGAGTDLIDYSDFTLGVTVDLSQVTQQTIVGTKKDTLTNLEGVIGGSSSDTLTGNSGADFLYGNEGDDLLKGSLGADVINGGMGNLDAIDYSASTAGVTVNFINALGNGGFAAGDSYSGIEKVIGSAYTDTLTGKDDQENFLSGGGGNDILTGGNKSDTFFTWTGNDTVDGLGDIDTLDYRSLDVGITMNIIPVNDYQVTFTKDSVTYNQILRNIENIIGTNQQDILNGNDMDNTFFATKGGDTLAGGGGMDTVDFRDTYNAVELSLNEGGFLDATLDNYTQTTYVAAGLNANHRGQATVNFIEGGWETTTLINIEKLHGTTGNDHLGGGYGIADTLEGDSGDDVLYGSTYGDILDGGTGFDTVDYSESCFKGVKITLSNPDKNGVVNAQETVVDSLASGDRLIGIEKIIGTDFTDTITVNDTADKPINLQIQAGKGDDFLQGGYGDNLFIDGEGNDTMHGNQGHDTVSYADHGNQGRVFNAQTGYVFLYDETGGIIEQDRVTGIELFIGTDQSTQISSINSHEGDDRFIADESVSVSFDGGTGFDTVSFANCMSVSVDLENEIASLREPLAGILPATLKHVETVEGSTHSDEITGAYDVNETLLGLDGNDSLNGRGGNDSLDGGTGNDTLTGGTGDDLMTGGAGADIFTFETFQDSINGVAGVADVIQDFTRGTDHINVSALNLAWDNIVLGGDGINTTVTLTSTAAHPINDNAYLGFTFALKGVSSLAASDFIFG